MKIAIIHSALNGVVSPDNQDTLDQAASVREALERKGAIVELFPFDLGFSTLGSKIKKYSPNLLFNLVEAVNGKDSLAFLGAFFAEQLRIPFTGSSSRALYLTTDKLVANQILKAEGVRVPDWLPKRVLSAMASRPDAEAELPCPFIVKAVAADCSLGLSKDSVQFKPTPRSLLRAIELWEQEYGEDWFAEQYLDGREFNVSMYERADEEVVVLPCAEMQFIDFEANEPKLVCYQSKWDEQSSQFKRTVPKFDFNRDDQELAEQLSTIARVVWSTFDLSGYARIDFRVSSAGLIYVLEANANPCLSPGAGFHLAADRSGLSYDDTVMRVVEATRLG